MIVRLLAFVIISSDAYIPLFIHSYIHIFILIHDAEKAIEGRLQLDAEINTKLVDWVLSAAVADREKKRPKYLPPRVPILLLE